MKIRWGVSPIGWVNDDLPTLGAGTTLDTILRDARAIGFAGIELGHLFPRDPALLVPIMAASGLAIIGGWHGMRLLAQDAEAEIAAMTPHLDLLCSVGAGIVIVAETANAVHGDRYHPLSAPPRLADGDWPEYGRRLDRVAAHVAGRGLSLAYHPHLGTVVESGADLDRLLAVTGPQVGLTIDTGHAFYGGIDPVAVVGAWPERIVHVHAKDVRADRHAAVVHAGGSFLDGVVAGMFTTPGDGDYDHAPLVAALRAIDYAGWIVIEAEQDPAVADPRRYAAAGLGTLRRMVGG